MKNMYTRNLVCLLIMFSIWFIRGSRCGFQDVVIYANSLEGILGLRDPRKQDINASASDLDEYVPYAKADGTSAGSYNDLVHQAFLQEFNAAVDFTIPYAKGEVSMIFKSLMRKFLLTIAYFIQAGATIWILEHMVSTVFGVPPSQHIGMLFFLFSTLLFSQKEKLGRNLDRLGFVVVVWVLVVLILTSTYTATLSSMLSTGGRDVNRLEYFSMTTFNPRHAREFPDFDIGGSGGGGGNSSAARGQPREMDTGGMQHWWKKVWCFLRKMAPRH